MTKLDSEATFGSQLHTSQECSEYRTSDYQMGYDEGYAARDAETCEWRFLWDEYSSVYEPACDIGAHYAHDGDFCPNCGRRVVVKEVK